MEMVYLFTLICLISFSVSCNFDSRLCLDWSQSTADVFDWTRGRGTTPSSNTGPSSDHTSESGLYLTLILA